MFEVGLENPEFVFLDGVAEEGLDRDAEAKRFSVSLQNMTDISRLAELLSHLADRKAQLLDGFFLELCLRNLLTHKVSPLDILLDGSYLVFVLDEQVETLPDGILCLLDADFVRKKALQEVILELAQGFSSPLLFLKLFEPL